MQKVEHHIYKIRPESITEPLIIRDHNNLIFCFLATEKNKSNKGWSNCGTAIFKTKTCWLSKYGYPNDEAMSCHPLIAFGYDGATIAEIKNSNWIAEIESQNRKKWINSDFSHLKHFIFPFKETTLEILVEDINYKISQKSYPLIRQEMLDWIVKNEY